MKALRIIGLYLFDLWNLVFPSDEWIEEGERELRE